MQDRFFRRKRKSCTGSKGVNDLTGWSQQGTQHVKVQGARGLRGGISRGRGLCLQKRNETGQDAVLDEHDRKLGKDKGERPIEKG